MDGESLRFRKNLECEVRAIEEILTPVQGCPAEMTSIEYGFANPMNNKSYVLGEACYDEERVQTLFVHTSVRRGYRDEDLEKTALRFRDADYFNQEHPLSRFKLDFLMAARLDTLNLRLATVFDGAVIPDLVQHRFVGANVLMNYQFYNVHKLGWNYVMLNGREVVDSFADSVRKAMKSLPLDKTVDLYIGSHGVLELPGKNGVKTGVFMDGAKFPVAKYIWFVLHNGQSAVAYIVLNQADGNVAVEAAELCPNRCLAPQYCCEYKEFQQKVTEMPLLPGTFELLTESSEFEKALYNTQV